MRTRFLGLVLALAVPTLAAAHIQLGAALDGAQAGTPSTGTATATFTLAPDDTLQYQVTTTQPLSGPVIAAHLHQAPRGQSNPTPLIPLDATTLAGTVVLKDVPNLDVEAAKAALVAGQLYVNLHTAAYPLGEIRGQVELRAVDGTTCSCAQAASVRAFRKCVQAQIKGLEKDERRRDGIKQLKRAVAKASCGRTKVGKKAIACCLAPTPDENIVVERLCAPVSEKACGKLGGTSGGAGSSCIPTNPCTP
jgi:hypothetical protein